jgi:DNA-binding XRE family transcriptional regulator
MDCAKIGHLITQLRKEKGLTQKNIADALNISNKTVSKWECGLGCPDVSLWPELSVILGVDIKQMIEGEITRNRPDSGNIDKIRFYVCPSCHNILVSTGSSSIFCCGRKLDQLSPIVNHDTPNITTEVVDADTL